MPNRREVFKFGFGGALTELSCGGEARAEKSQLCRTTSDLKSKIEVDVVVVGGGFSGVAAARRISDQGKSVAIIEAKDRLGGRTYTKTMESGLHRFDVGGIWIGPTQKRCMELVKRFKIQLSPTYNRGNSVLEENGSVSHYQGSIPKLGLLALADFGIAFERLDQLSRKVNLESPWKTPNAYHFDSLTVANWISENTWNSTSESLLHGAMEQLLSADPRRVSFLHLLFFLKSAGGIQALIAVEGGAQQYRFRNGTADLIQKLAEPVLDKTWLSSPVRSIEQTETRVAVESDRVSVTAKRAIVAMAPTISSRIDCAPLLSAERDHLCQSMPMGSVIKFFVIYPKPFWRNDGLSGQIVSLNGPIFSTFDHCQPDSEEGVLVGFLVGKFADQMRKLSPEIRKNRVLEHLGILFGRGATDPKHYFEHDWAQERFIRGCFLGYLPPGIWTSLGEALWKPQGRIHWAGTETAREWNGYIEGALEAGLRAADEALGGLQ